jgi:hypothetical protein
VPSDGKIIILYENFRRFNAAYCLSDAKLIYFFLTLSLPVSPDYFVLWPRFSTISGKVLSIFAVKLLKR